MDSIKTANYTLNPQIDTYDTAKIRIKFNGSCLKRFPPTIFHGGIVNIYIVYDITNNFNATNYPTLKYCFFESVKLTKLVDIDQHKCSGYGIEFDGKGFFSISNEIGRNLIIFEVDMCSSTKIDNDKKEF